MKKNGERLWAAPLELPQATNRGGSSITFVSMMVSKQKSHFQQRHT